MSYAINVLTGGTFPDGLSGAHCIKPVISIVFAKAAVLLSLGSHGNLGLGLRAAVGKPSLAMSICVVELGRLLDWGLRMGAVAIAGLGSAHRGLVHGLEGVVSWHSRVVQVGLLRVVGVAT